MVEIEEEIKEKIRTKVESKTRFIIMVDDDPLTNYINAKMLRYMGANAIIQSFDNGKDALKSIQSLSVPEIEVTDLCILLDLQMVEMDGFEFLERLKIMNLDFKTRIYIVSGSMPVDRLPQLQKFSLAGFFLKPLSKGNIKEVLMPKDPVFFTQTSN